MRMHDLKYFLKDSIRKSVDFSRTDQSRGVPPPLIEKPCPKGVRKIDLPGSQQWQTVKPIPLADAIANRKSRRTATRGSLPLEELSFLLWATQGVRQKEGMYHALRTVPSAGCRHSFETYIAAFRVEGLEKGIYRYLPLSHQLAEVTTEENLEHQVTRMAMGQSFAGKSAVTFIWTTVTSRMEWRYGMAAYKVIAMDAGHVCQNLYLACEAVGCGTCAIGAYDQEYADAVLDVDGEDEFTIYIAPVSKL
ncbi:MAG: SagB/ThcOx family dehydrogenase [Desulfobacterales bacterium]|nr:SagB/ThcOx family dehydrogenase [Desulfobacterales bacterium]